MLFNGEAGIIKTADDTNITISFTSGDACDTCGLKVICAPGKQSERNLILPNSGLFDIGQRIQVEERGNLELHLALIQFGLPMLLFLAGLGLGYALPQAWMPKELMSFMVALLGLGVSFFAARQMVQKITDVIPGKYLQIVPLTD
jgi:positive regulator of sigma E activity